jgi:serine/threonine protein kinase
MTGRCCHRDHAAVGARHRLPGAVDVVGWPAMTIQRVAGRYSLDREVGRGGAGAVWLGHDDVLLREVALKRIGLPPGAMEAEVARADREARLAAQVTHPNVVAVFDFLEEGDQHWLVMEYVAGTNLARMVRDQGPLPPETAARLIGQAATGLAAAHALGIVHRDVKPSNILVGEDGVAKLSDFGIARGTSDATLTQTGLVTGSPAYLAPEVATGGSATAASDVWSLGTSLFHALAGHPPYHVDSEHPLATLYRIANEPPPRLPTDGRLAAVLEATMTPDPARRPSAGEVAAFLASHEPAGTVTQALPPPPPPGPPGSGASERPDERRRARQPLLIGALAIAVVALVGAVLLLIAPSGDDDPTPTAAESTAPATTEDEDPPPSSSPSEPERPTEAELEEFARTYVATASSDPDAGFEMLTDDYQSASPRYHEFWRSLRNPRILRVAADPDDLRVSYTYRYQLPGVGRRTEDVQLELVQVGDRLLIAGAT